MDSNPSVLLVFPPKGRWMKQKAQHSRTRFSLGIVSLVVGLAASNFALFDWIEQTGVHYLLGYYARYVCAYGGFFAMIFGAMLVNEYLVFRKTSAEKGVPREAGQRRGKTKAKEKTAATKVAAGLTVILIFFHPLMSASSLVLYTATVYIAPTSPSGSLLLYANGDNEVMTGWKRTGVNPYLDAVDYNASFLSVKGPNRAAGEFNFTDSGKTWETIQNVTVQLYAKLSLPGDDIEVFIWNGSQWTSLGIQQISPSWTWSNWTATSQLNSWTKIDNARMYFVSIRRPGVNEFFVDCARILVDYSN